MAFYDAHLLKTARNLEAREELFNLSIVVARTKEGTLVRKVDALELITVPDLEMPIGAYAWQNRFN
uniref:Uncharacterized protein n=1 Tax=Panagrolaimus sp. ES5 TaxID=591445 RepID=A0AC34G9A6_9BILA